jgi:hypothetical protein
VDLLCLKQRSAAGGKSVGRSGSMGSNDARTGQVRASRLGSKTPVGQRANFLVLPQRGIAFPFGYEISDATIRTLSGRVEQVR